MKRASRKRSAGRRRTNASCDSGEGSLSRKLKEKVLTENVSLTNDSVELKSHKRQLNETQARLTATNKENARLHHMLSDLEGICRKHQAEAARWKEQVDDLQFNLKEANYANSKLQKDLTVAQGAVLDQQRSAQKQLAGLREALEDLESAMQSKMMTAKRNLNKCTRLSNAVSAAVGGLTLQPTVKNVVLKHLKELNYCVETTLNALGSDLASTQREDELRKSQSKDAELENARLRDEIADLRKQGESIAQYRAAFDRMRSQTKQLRERLQELESDGSHKRLVAELENKVTRLESEKQFSMEHIKSLQMTLTEQTSVIEHMRGLIASLSNLKPQTPSHVDLMEMRSPQKTVLQMPFKSQSPQFDDLDSHIEQVYMETKDELTLQDEINDLDIEIQQLQSSLQRALGQ